MEVINPAIFVQKYRDQIKTEITQKAYQIRILGLLANKDPAALKYAEYTQKACIAVGIDFILEELSAGALEARILTANEDQNIHGIFIYYPIFDRERDAYLKNLVCKTKDVEGLTDYWIEKLYKNERYDDPEQKFKSLLPCTPLAIVKILFELEKSVRGKTITIFNRSEVVGRPLASMLSHDGARVYSFDLDGVIQFSDMQEKKIEISRKNALKESDIIITGVPSKSFQKIQVDEVNQKQIGLNFSTIANFDKSSRHALASFVPRVGPLTVTMCLRNALRLFINYHLK